MKISVAGTGYVGLVTAVCLAENGNTVTCVDINEEKVKLLNSGVSPIYEPQLEELMWKNSDKITFVTEYSEAYKDADVIIVAVGTPERKDGSANLQYINEVAKQIANTVIKDCVVAIKSTVPIGTNDKIEKIIKENLKHEVNIDVVSNPEFLAQGSAVKDTLEATRIVLGVESENAEKIMRDVYKNFDIPFVVTNRNSAEMIKYAANDFLALKVSYINEIANLCEIVGANIEDVSKGMGMDPRIGDKFLNAGIGYGGSCFPKDTKALHWLANYNDYEIKTIKATIDVNENQKIKLIKKARKYFNSFNGLTVAVLGLTFKPGTDDLREAPSLTNIPILLEDGAKINVWDPVGMDNFKKVFTDSVNYSSSIEEAITNADVCFIFTEWSDIKEFEIEKYVKLMNRPLVIDGRNCYDVEKVMNTNIIYESIGRKATIGIKETEKVQLKI
ncbi:UDP-glucose/GDP-mannose dehydrogenase family protein [Peribacillus frigoritolerans]|uniref:UDP-glucose dehydrogenase family protein n=1 Tax=Peribacillus frigoritolerans TaxID=450367 RepID=UPI0024C12A74|nr:UDP-glucose/GDP-mannose dehydrogenase family protein [Peribacillus frigoritolerans]WHX65529.1 UDP-glucose/GDP-mannose dehydrogenase family protein [Peribacillus frigoritolerans]